MKVIRKGCGWSEEIECSNENCQSVLLVERDDVFRVQYDEIFNENFNDYFTCPECKMDTLVTADLPFQPRGKPLDGD